MASPPSEDDDFDDEDEDDELEEGTEASRPCAVASQVKYRARTFHLWYFTNMWLSNIIILLVLALNYVFLNHSNES